MPNEPWSEPRAAGIIAEHVHLEGRDAADPARAAGDLRLCRRGGGAADRRRAEPVARRGARLHHLLPRLPPRTRPAATCEALPGRGLPGHGLATRCMRRSCSRLGIDWHGTTADGGVTLEPVYCLGLCASAPAALSTASRSRRLDRRCPRQPRLTEMHGVSVTIFVPRDARALALGADAVAARAVRRRRARAALDVDHRAHRLARPVLAGAAGRGRDAGGPHRLRAGDAGRRGRPVRRRLPRRRRASAAPRAGRRRSRISRASSG